jgi:hypothetical protein
MLAHSAVATIANEMRKKWASAQKIKLPQISLCRNKAELSCVVPIESHCVVRKAGTILVGKLCQRIISLMLFGVMFILEAAWIFFLAYASWWLLLPGRS